MTANSVAGEGDVFATPGKVLFKGATKGSWAAGHIFYVPHAHLKIDGAPAISQASCTFAFTGDVSGTEPVTLSPGATKLQCGPASVLVHGDTITSSQYGNQLQVSSTRKLKTS